MPLLSLCTYAAAVQQPPPLRPPLHSTHLHPSLPPTPLPSSPPVPLPLPLPVPTHFAHMAAQPPPLSAARPPHPSAPSSVSSALSSVPTAVSTVHPPSHHSALPVAPTPNTQSTAPSPPSTNPDQTAQQQITIPNIFLRLDRQTQILLDRIAPYKLYRWLALTALLSIFMLRMYLLEGFYIITYVLFIFILNQFILFLQPKDRASLVARAASPADSGPVLPTADDDEFRPFVRRLPEFKFWYSTTYATLLAFFATFFQFLDVPVFWPVLLFYFILLFVATMRRQWYDMKRLKYVPWDIGTKKVYKSDPKRVSVTRPQQQQQQQKPSAPPTNAARTAPVPTVPVKKTAALSQ